MLKDWLEEGERIQGKTLRAKFEMNLYGNSSGIFNDDDEPIASYTSANAEYSVRTELFHKKFVLFSKLNEIARDGGSLKLECKLWIRGKLNQRFIYKNALPMPKYRRILRRNHKLSHDLSELLKTGQHWDFIIAVEKDEFKVHKAFLSARSPVFRRMFESNMLESTESKLQIQDFEKDVIEAMLYYIYTGETKLIETHVIPLLQCAEKWELTELKEQCEETLVKKLSLENAAETFILADIYNADFLKKEVIDYINKNKADISSTKAFKELIVNKPHLFAELYLAEITYSNNNQAPEQSNPKPESSSLLVVDAGSSVTVPLPQHS